MNYVLLSSSVGSFLVVKNSLAMGRRHSFSEHMSVRRPDTVFCTFWLFCGAGVTQWLRHCATSRTVPGLNPGGVGRRDFFSGLPTEPCALGSTQPLNMSTRDYFWGKGGRCVRLTTYNPCSADCQVFRGLNLPGPLGPSRRPVVGDLYLYLIWLFCVWTMVCHWETNTLRLPKDYRI
jgi:hypothetical protein